MTIRIFFSYSHQDKGHLERLTKHLAPLFREKDIDPWFDGNIDPGQAITPEIRKAMLSTDIFVALASSNYLASDYCYRKEYRPMLRKSKQGRPKVVVALVGTCDWPSTEMAAYKMLPDDAKSVDKHGNRDQAYLEIVKGVRRVVRAVRQEKGKAQAKIEKLAAEKQKAAAARKLEKQKARVKLEGAGGAHSRAKVSETATKNSVAKSSRPKIKSPPVAHNQKATNTSTKRTNAAKHK